MMQIIEQTHDETVAMYMQSCSKAQLAEMLANCNEILGSRPAWIGWDLGVREGSVTKVSILPARFY